MIRIISFYPTYIPYMNFAVLRLFVLLCLLSAIAACTPDEAPLSESCASAIDLPNTPKVDLTVLRYEQDLLAIDTANLVADLAQLDSKYGDFNDFYLTRLMAPPGYTREQTARAVVASPLFDKIGDTTAQVYADFGPWTTQLEDALQRYRYYFPEAPAPDTVITLINEFNYAAFTYGDGVLGIGLEAFLGGEYSLLPPTDEFPKYRRRTMNSDHLATKAMYIILQQVVPQPEQPRLLDEMLYRAKLLYALDRVMPCAPDSAKWEVTREQVAFLRSSDQEIWKFVLQQDLLYSTDRATIAKYTAPGPSSPGMPDVAPARTVVYLGYRILQQAMRKNPDLTLTDMLAITDAQRLLELSKYQP